MIGILASCNINRGSTYFICSNLSSVEEPGDDEGRSEAIGAGKFILFNDDDVVRVARGINSMTTTDGITKTEDMKFIDIVEAMDLISDDISKVFKETYIGNYKNNYDNQVLFISAINTYFKELANDYVLDNNYSNKADVDVEAQRLCLLYTSVNFHANRKNEIEAKKLEKTEKIEKEYERLKEVFKNIDENSAKLIDGLLKETAYLKIELLEMREILNKSGMIKVHPNDYLKQKALPIANEYRRTVNIYSLNIKGLNGILNKTVCDEDDPFDEWLKSKKISME